MDLLFMQNELNRKACASSLHLLCENCGWKHSFYTSEQQGKSFEVNRRLVYSMRTIGKRHTSAKKATKNYTKISTVITTCVRSIAKDSMSQAAEELRNLTGQNDSNETETVDCGVSCDGTLQKRGFSSRNG